MKKRDSLYASQAKKIDADEAVKSFMDNCSDSFEGSGIFTEKKREFVCYWWFVGWDCFSLGFHISLMSPNIEIHLPFGFFRIGWVIQTESEFFTVKK